MKTKLLHKFRQIYVITYWPKGYNNKNYAGPTITLERNTPRYGSLEDIREYNGNLESLAVFINRTKISFLDTAFKKFASEYSNLGRNKRRTKSKVKIWP